MDLSIVIVSWNVRDLLISCLNSVFDEINNLIDNENLQSEVFVIDNASSDGTAAAVADQFPKVVLIANSENAGFTRGNNQALRITQGRYVCLLNPDCVVKPSAFAKMISYMDKNPKIGAAGPRMFYPDGSVQSSRRRFPSLLTGILESTVLQRWFGKSKLVQRYYVNDRRDDKTQPVDWLVGACIMIRGEALQQVGILDENFFMYSEELDWCKRAKKMGWQITFLPEAEVIHYEGKSSEQNLLKRHIYFNDSKIRYFRKHHGRISGMLIHLFILGNFVYQLFEESLKFLLVSRNREMRKNRLSVLLRVCKHQLVSFVKG